MTSKGKFTKEDHQSYCDIAQKSQSIRTRNVKPLISRYSNVPGKFVHMKDIISEDDSERTVVGPNGKQFKSSWEKLWTDRFPDISLEAAGVFTDEHPVKYFKDRAGRGKERYWWTGTDDDGRLHWADAIDWDDAVVSGIGVCSNWTKEVSSEPSVGGDNSRWDGMVGESKDHEYWIL